MNYVILPIINVLGLMCEKNWVIVTLNHTVNPPLRVHLFERNLEDPNSPLSHIRGQDKWSRSYPHFLKQIDILIYEKDRHKYK